MRAHIVLDDGLLREAMRHSQARTKRALANLRERRPARAELGLRVVGHRVETARG